MTVHEPYFPDRECTALVRGPALPDADIELFTLDESRELRIEVESTWPQRCRSSIRSTSRGDSDLPFAIDYAESAAQHAARNPLRGVIVGGGGRHRLSVRVSVQAE